MSRVFIYHQQQQQQQQNFTFSPFCPGGKLLHRNHYHFSIENHNSIEKATNVYTLFNHTAAIRFQPIEPFTVTISPFNTSLVQSSTAFTAEELTYIADFHQTIEVKQSHPS